MLPADAKSGLRVLCLAAAGVERSALARDELGIAMAVVLQPRDVGVCTTADGAMGLRD